MANLMEEFMKDGMPVELSNDELAEIATLAQAQQDWETRVTQLETDLDHAKEALRNIQEHLLPEAMLTVGMSEFKLSSGAKITIRDDVYASIRKDAMDKAVLWLDSKGLGDVVKDKVEFDFGRGSQTEVHKLMMWAQKQGMMPTEKLSVHPMTLKALVREQMEKGVTFPEELFSIAPVRKAIIKSSK